MRFIRDAEAKLITHTGAEEIDPLQLQLRVLKNKPQSEGRIRPQRMGKLSKHHKNGDGELQLISHGKVTGYLFANILGPLHYGSGAWVGHPVVIILSG